MDKEFFLQNRDKLYKKIRDGLFVFFAGEAPIRIGDNFYDFAVNRNFYYLSGLDSEKCILAFTVKDAKAKEFLFIERYDPLVAKWDGAALSIEDAKEKSGIDDIRYIDEFEEFIAKEIFDNEHEEIYLDLEKQEWSKGLSKAGEFAFELKKKFQYLKMRDSFKIVANLRILKEQEEVDRLDKAVEAVNGGFLSALKNVKKAKNEREIEAYFELGIKLNGAQGVSFSPIIASGKNACVLHYTNNNADINNGDLILMDIGAERDLYCSDVTRTVPANGVYSERQKEIYNIVLAAMDEVFKILKPGTSFDSLNKVVIKYYQKALKKIGLIENDSELTKYFYHNVSHPLGLETHDVGSRKDLVLRAGMVLTVEPGLYIAEEGIGIRIEDDVLITKTSYRNLSADIIKTVDEIERFMAE